VLVAAHRRFEKFPKIHLASDSPDWDFDCSRFVPFFNAWQSNFEPEIGCLGAVSGSWRFRGGKARFPYLNERKQAAVIRRLKRLEIGGALRFAFGF